jgi:hypothetical protein
MRLAVKPPLRAFGGGLGKAVTLMTEQNGVHIVDGAS